MLFQFRIRSLDGVEYEQTLVEFADFHAAAEAGLQWADKVGCRLQFIDICEELPIGAESKLL